MLRAPLFGATFLILLWNQSRTHCVSANQIVSLLWLVTVYLIILVALLLRSGFFGTCLLDFLWCDWGHRPFLAEVLDHIWKEIFGSGFPLIGLNELGLAWLKPVMLVFVNPWSTCHIEWVELLIESSIETKFQGVFSRSSCYAVEPLTTQIVFWSFVMFGWPFFFFLATCSTPYPEWPVYKKARLSHVLYLNFLTTNRYIGQQCLAGVPWHCRRSDSLCSHWSWTASSSWNTSATAWSTPTCSDWCEFATIWSTRRAQRAIWNAELDRRFYGSLYIQQSCLKHCSLVTSPYLPGSSAGRLSPRKGTKYYAIIIGKCTGVYYGEWYVNI